MLSSHLLDEVERTCDAVAIVERGRIVRQGPLAELVAEAGGLTVQVECSEPTKAAALVEQGGIAASAAPAEAGMTVTLAAGASRETVAEINRRLVAGGISVYALREVQTTLEDWFLSVTDRSGRAAMTDTASAARQVHAGQAVSERIGPHRCDGTPMELPLPHLGAHRDQAARAAQAARPHAGRRRADRRGAGPHPWRERTSARGKSKDRTAGPHWLCCSSPAWSPSSASSRPLPWGRPPRPPT